MTVTTLVRAAAVCCTLFASVQVSADQPPPGQDRGGPRKPPQEAYSACVDESEGDECAVKFGDRNITGTCVADREDGKLFCRPSRPPGPPPEGRGRPPGEPRD
jgi:hypothetical protein